MSCFSQKNNCHPLLKHSIPWKFSIFISLLVVHALVIVGRKPTTSPFSSLISDWLCLGPCKCFCTFFFSSWKNAKNWLRCFVNTYAWVDTIRMSTVLILSGRIKDVVSLNGIFWRHTIDTVANNNNNKNTNLALWRCKRIVIHLSLLKVRD